MLRSFECTNNKVTLNVLFQTCFEVVKLPETLDFTLNRQKKLSHLEIIWRSDSCQVLFSCTVFTSTVLCWLHVRNLGLVPVNENMTYILKARCSVTQPPWQWMSVGRFQPKTGFEHARACARVHFCGKTNTKRWCECRGVTTVPPGDRTLPVRC